MVHLLWHVPTVMIVLLIAGLMMGQRHVGELSVFDLLTGISIGAVAGAGIVDLSLPHLPVLAAILGLAFFHFLITEAKMRWRMIGRLFTFEPTVVIKNGKPIKQNMRRLRVTLPDLLPLMREKDVFDIREVAYGVLEPDGKLTVIKATQPPKSTGLTSAVIIDGQVDSRTLRSFGWSEDQLQNELARRGYDCPGDIFLGTLDEGGDLYLVPTGARPEAPVIFH